MVMCFITAFLAPARTYLQRVPANLARAIQKKISGIVTGKMQSVRWPVTSSSKKGWKI